MSESVLNKIRNELNIVEIISEYLPLKKKGKNFWGVCPFHNDTSPSMSVSPDKQIYTCFSCGAGGDVIKFVADKEKISRDKAIEKLAKRLGLTYEVETHISYSETDQKIINALSDAMNFYQYVLSIDENSIGFTYAYGRGLTPELCEKFKIGFASEKYPLKEFLLGKNHDEAVMINASLINSYGKDFFRNRLIFGITNENGQVVGMSGRTLTNEAAKYINSAESTVFKKSHLLYNYYNAKDAAYNAKEIYICEGQMDVIALAKANIFNAVAILGTALTPHHIPLLKGLKVILNLDADNAGTSASIKSILLLLENKISVSVVKNTAGKDADEIVSKDGVEKLHEVLSNRISALEFVYEKHLEKYDITDAEKITELVKSLDKYLRFASLVERDLLINKMVEDLKISKEAIASMLSNNSYQTKPWTAASREENTPPKTTKSVNPIAENDFVQKPKQELHKVNYAYALVRSLAQKPILINSFIKYEVNFVDVQLSKIANYFADYVKTGNKPAISSEMKAKIIDIQNESQFVVDDENGLNNLIKNVNREFYDHYINVYKVKLNNQNLSVEDKTKILDIITKFKKKKESS